MRRDGEALVTRRERVDVGGREDVREPAAVLDPALDDVDARERLRLDPPADLAEVLARADEHEPAIALRAARGHSDAPGVEERVEPLAPELHLAVPGDDLRTGRDAEGGAAGDAVPASPERDVDGVRDARDPGCGKPVRAREPRSTSASGATTRPAHRRSARGRVHRSRRLCCSSPPWNDPYTGSPARPPTATQTSNRGFS